MHTAGGRAAIGSAGSAIFASRCVTIPIAACTLDKKLQKINIKKERKEAGDREKGERKGRKKGER